MPERKTIPDPIEATLKIEGWKLKIWDELLRKGKVDYDKWGLPKFGVPFKSSIDFPNGMSATVMVCTDTPDAGTLWTQGVLYDESGCDIDHTDPGDCLSGLYDLFDGDQKYSVTVESKLPGSYDSIYVRLKTSRDDFVSLVRKELENGLAADYSGRIAEKIANEVAVDVFESADIEKWNDCDVRLGIGRVIALKTGADE